MNKLFISLFLLSALVLTGQEASAKGKNMNVAPEQEPAMQVQENKAPEQIIAVLPQTNPAIPPQDAQQTEEAKTPALAPERQQLFNTIVRETDAAMLPLREGMLAKALELRALSANPQASRQDIADVCRQMAALHTQMILLHEKMADRLEKEVGVVIQRGHCGGNCNGFGMDMPVPPRRGAGHGLRPACPGMMSSHMPAPCMQQPAAPAK